MAKDKTQRRKHRKPKNRIANFCACAAACVGSTVGSAAGVDGDVAVKTFERGLRRDLQTKCARSRLKPFICKPTAKNETEN